MRVPTFLMLTIALAVTATAQVPTSGNIFVGYTYSGGDAFIHSAGLTGSHSTNLHGWEGSLEGKFLPWVGIVVDISGHYGSQNVGACPAPPLLPPCVVAHVDVKRYTALFGPRVSIPVGKFTPFAHFLVGAGHVTDSGSGFSDSDTSFATAIGGGLDYKLIKGIAVRLQGDALHTKFFDISHTHLRFSTGLVLRF